MPPPSSIPHYTRPTCCLSQHHQYATFFCSACCLPGYGLRYRCIPCNVDLHCYCATCPTHISFFMHSSHTLELLIPNPQWSFVCNVCRAPIRGILFRCPVVQCNFHAHPICTQLPGSVGEDLVHPYHALTCVSAGPSRCGACWRECNGWRYRCGRGCGVDFHVECLRGPVTGGGEQDHGPRRRWDVIYAVVSHAETAMSIFNILSTIFAGFGGLFN